MSDQRIRPEPRKERSMKKGQTRTRPIVSAWAMVIPLCVAAMQAALLPQSVGAAFVPEYEVKNVGFTNADRVAPVQPGVAGDGRVAGGSSFGKEFHAARTNAALTQ